MNNCIVYINNLKDNFQKKMFFNSISSLREYTNVDCYLITERIESKNQKKYLDFKNIEIINIDNLASTYFSNDAILNCKYFTKYCFYKLLIPLVEKLFKYNKILYLDCDTLIKKDISNVFKINQDNKEITFFYSKEHDLHTEKYYKQNREIRDKLLNIYGKDYLTSDYLTKSYIHRYNAGVMLYNNDLFKCKLNELDKKIHYINKIYSIDLFSFAEQDLFNYYFTNNVSYEKYNERSLSDECFIWHYWGKKTENDRCKLKDYSELIMNLM